MNTQKKARSLYWDIVKGWGIIAIVLGHTGYFAGAFVYLFHLALFFFITGYFYNETKYGDTPFLYFGSRLAGAWPRYMFYTLFFVLLHNFFVTHRLYAGQELYNHTRMLTAWMSSLSFNSPEQVQGALWFLPVWLVSSGLFAGCVWFGRAAARFTRKDNVKLPVCAFACILIGLAGVFLNMRSCPLPYNLQAALLVVPVYLIAWLMQQFFQFPPLYGLVRLPDKRPASAPDEHKASHFHRSGKHAHSGRLILSDLHHWNLLRPFALRPVRAHQTAGKGPCLFRTPFL